MKSEPSKPTFEEMKAMLGSMLDPINEIIADTITQIIPYETQTLHQARKAHDKIMEAAAEIGRLPAFLNRLREYRGEVDAAGAGKKKRAHGHRRGQR